MNLLAEGAESQIYKTRIMGQEAILKRRARKKYRIVEIESKIIASRSRNEAAIMASASKVGINSPVLLLCDRYDIYMSRIVGKRLDDFLKIKKKNDRLLEDVGKALGILHNNDIVHGDYTPANIIVSNGMPVVIDFGLSEITNSMEEKALDIILMKRSLEKSQYDAFIKGYKITCRRHKEAIAKLNEIEKRGRYQTRTVLTVGDT